MTFLLTISVFALVLTVLAVVVYALNKCNPATTPRPYPDYRPREHRPTRPDLR
jgi:hypothetical protein